MKQTKKNYIFSNFDPQISNKKVLKSDLKIENIYNLKVDRGIIEPVHNFTDFFKDNFSKDNYQTFLSCNQAFIAHILYVTVYEYENPENKTIDKRIFVIDDNYYLFELNNITFSFDSLSINFKEFPKILNANGKLYFYNKNEYFVMIDCNHSPVLLADIPNLTDFANTSAFTYFAVKDENLKLYYTELTDIENLTDELENYDYISVNPNGGKILKLLTYKDSLYIVQQYTISKIYTNSKISAPQISCEISSQIFENTICFHDDCIVFFSSAGLFLFDGNDIKPIFKNLTNNICGEKFIATSYNNLYFLTCDLYINESSENVLISFDIENNTSNIFKFGDITNLYVIQTFNVYELIVVTNSNSEIQILKLNKTQLTKNSKYLKFNKITFDDMYLKVLNTLKFSSHGNFQIKISSDQGYLIFDATDNFEVGNIGLKGHIFELEISSENSFYIETIYAEVLSVEE